MRRTTRHLCLGLGLFGSLLAGACSGSNDPVYVGGGGSIERIERIERRCKRGRLHRVCGKRLSGPDLGLLFRGRVP